MRNGAQYGVTPNLTSINPELGDEWGFLAIDYLSSQTILPLSVAGKLDSWNIPFSATGFGGGFYLGMRNTKGKVGLSTTFVSSNCTTAPLCGKSWRIWPVTDQLGNIVPNTMLAAFDVQGPDANYDVSITDLIVFPYF